MIYGIEATFPGAESEKVEAVANFLALLAPANFEVNRGDETTVKAGGDDWDKALAALMILVLVCDSIDCKGRNSTTPFTFGPDDTVRHDLGRILGGDRPVHHKLPEIIQ